MLPILSIKDKIKIHDFNIKYFNELEGDELRYFNLWLYNLQNKYFKNKDDEKMILRIKFLIDDRHKLVNKKAI